MIGPDFRDVSPNVTLESIPGHAGALAASAKRARPCPADLGSEHAEPFQIRWNCPVARVTLHHATDPGADLSDGRMASFHQVVWYRPQRRSNAGGDSHAPDCEARFIRVTAQMRVTRRKSNFSGRCCPRPARRSAAYRPNSRNRGFSSFSERPNFAIRSRNESRKRRARTLFRSPRRCRPHSGRRWHPLSPFCFATGGSGGRRRSADKYWRGAARSPRLAAYLSVLRTSIHFRQRQAVSHLRINRKSRRSAILCSRKHHPFVIDRVEERADVGVEHPVHSFLMDDDPECVQRFMLTSPLPESLGKAEEVRLVDCIQDRRHRVLDDLILQRSDSESVSVCHSTWGYTPGETGVLGSGLIGPCPKALLFARRALPHSRAMSSRRRRASPSPARESQDAISVRTADLSPYQIPAISQPPAVASSVAASSNRCPPAGIKLGWGNCRHAMSSCCQLRRWQPS
ncbi:hypothetical protein SAMN05192541_12297 [Bradyrhizobium arachidis]|nr:hypothetical protein SAMN05192541_12297 [Bradyrhizobium arachidis]